MRLRFRPIEVWPGALTRDRDPSPFRSTWTATLDLLDRELTAVRADNVVVQLAVAESAIRLDGTLRSDRRPPEHPGVILSFEHPKAGAMSYPCDRFDSRPAADAWRENLRAVALGLEALRKVDRYGITSNGQQYTGWKALGSGIPMGAAVETMTADEAARLLCDAADYDARTYVPRLLGGDREIVDGVWRTASKRHHPDVGGDPETFRRLTMARNLLANLPPRLSTASR